MSRLILFKKPLFTQSNKIISGRIHSQTRAIKSVDEAAIFIDKTKHQYLYDIEGQCYIDACPGAP